MKQLVTLAALLVALAPVTSCKEEAACRPGTLFVRLTLDDAARTADHLRVVVVVDGVTRQTEVAYNGGETVELRFPDDQYPVGATVSVVVEAKTNGVVVTTAMQSGLVLPRSCGAVTLTFGGGGGGDGGPDLSIGDLGGDLGGADLPGVDQSVGDLGDDVDLTPTSEEDLTGPTVLANGDACTNPGQCASGNCVDGFCCDTPCDGQCQACDAGGSEGTCVGINGTPHGTRAACGGSGACAGTCVATTPAVCTFPGGAVSCREPSCSGGVKTLAAVCDGAGACPDVSTFDCPSSACNGGGTDCLGACTSNTECATPGDKPFCNLPEGVCRATKDEGASCANNTECTSNFCVDGVCCNSACTGQCQACNLATGGNTPGTCGKVVSGQPVTNAGTTRAACTGSGACQGTCDGTFTAQCNYPGNAVDCGTTCACTNGSGTCACSSTCATANKTPKKCDGLGACTTGTPVGCAANVCNAASNATDCGTCSSDGDCGSGRYCDAGNVCRIKKTNGQACSSVGGDHECQNNHCVQGLCCASACGGTTPICKADGSGCACTGASCGGGSLICQNGACCDNACPACRTGPVTNACGNACSGGFCGTQCAGTNNACCRAAEQACHTGSQDDGCANSPDYPSNCATSCAGGCCRTPPPTTCTTTAVSDGCGGTYTVCDGSTHKCTACGCILKTDTCCEEASTTWICSPPDNICNGINQCCGSGGCT